MLVLSSDIHFIKVFSKPSTPLSAKILCSHDTHQTIQCYKENLWRRYLHLTRCSTNRYSLLVQQRGNLRCAPQNLHPPHTRSLYLPATDVAVPRVQGCGLPLKAGCQKGTSNSSAETYKVRPNNGEMSKWNNRILMPFLWRQPLVFTQRRINM